MVAGGLDVISKAKLETPWRSKMRPFSSESRCVGSSTGAAVIPRSDIMGRIMTISPSRPSSSIGSSTVGHCQIS